MNNRSYNKWLLYSCFCLFWLHSQLLDLILSSERERCKKSLVCLKDTLCLHEFRCSWFHNHNESHLHGSYSWMRDYVLLVKSLFKWKTKVRGCSLLLFSTWWLFFFPYWKEHLIQNPASYLLLLTCCPDGNLYVNWKLTVSTLLKGWKYRHLHVFNDFS